MRFGTHWATRWTACACVDGVVALSVQYRTCDREAVGSSLGRARGVETLGKFFHTYVPLFTKQYKLVPAKGR